jgi:hypothetical protein
MPERIRKASSTTQRSRKTYGGGTKTVIKSKNVGANGGMVKSRKVIKSDKGHVHTAGSSIGATSKNVSVKTRTKERNIGGKGTKRLTKSYESNYTSKGGADGIDVSSLASTVKTKTSGRNFKTKVKENKSTFRAGNHTQDLTNYKKK